MFPRLVLLALSVLGAAATPQVAGAAWTSRNLSRGLGLHVFWESHSHPRPGPAGVAWILNWSSAAHTLVFYDGASFSHLTPYRLSIVGAGSALPAASDWGPTGLSAWGSGVAFCAVRLGFLQMTSQEMFYWEQGSTHRITYDALSDMRPSLYERTIAWQSRREDGPDDWEIRYWDGYGVRQITDNDVDDTDPSLYDRTIAWQSSEQIVWLSVPSNVYVPLPAPVVVGPGERPSISKNKIAYQASDGNDMEIFLYDMDSGRTTQITDNDYDDTDPCLQDGTAVWQGFDGNDWEVFYWDGRTTEQLTWNEVDDMEPSLWGTGLNTTIAYVESQESPVPFWFRSHITLTRAAATVSPAPGAEMSLTWPSLEGRTYRVEYSKDLVNWEVASDAVPSAGYGETSWTDDGSLTGVPPSLAPRRFYRVLENP